MQQDMHGKVNSRQDESLPTHQVLRDTLQDTIAVLQARRAVLGGALVDAALSPLLEQLAVLSSQPSPAGPRPPVAPGQRALLRHRGLDSA